MERQELIAQYDRFISQTREEIRGLYWLYNFFFLIESALVGGVFTGQLSGDYLLFGKLFGLVSSFYWFWVVRKQKLWRDHWMERILSVEKRLGYQELALWPHDPSSLSDFLFRKNGLWRALFILPLGFTTVWLALIFVS